MVRKMKCKFPNNLVIKPDGVNDLDPCIYEEVESLKNVTIHIMRCKNCGHIEISWEKQENTEIIREEEYYD